MSNNNKKDTKQCTLHGVMERYCLDDDFEQKVARMIDLKIALKRHGIENDEYEELGELQDWFTWGNWRHG